MLRQMLASTKYIVLAILFAKQAVARTSELDLFGLGIAVALMIGALSLFLVVNASTHRGTKSEDREKIE